MHLPAPFRALPDHIHALPNPFVSLFSPTAGRGHQGLLTVVTANLATSIATPRPLPRPPLLHTRPSEPFRIFIFTYRGTRASRAARCRHCQPGNVNRHSKPPSAPSLTTYTPFRTLSYLCFHLPRDAGIKACSLSSLTAWQLPSPLPRPP